MEPGLWKLMRRRDKREGSPKSTPGTDTANQQINLTSLKKKKNLIFGLAQSRKSLEVAYRVMVLVVGGGGGGDGG